MFARSLLAAGLSLTSAGAAMSDETTNRFTLSAPSHADQGTARNWSGAYAGVHGALASQKPNLGSGDRDLNMGGQLGYNFQYGPGVFGVEAEASWVDKTRVKVPGGELNERFRTALKAKAGINHRF